jgi:hypothetical protein
MEAELVRRRLGLETELRRRKLLPPLDANAAPSLDLLAWSTQHRIINGQPFTVSAPLLDLYRSTHPNVVVMKAAQVAISEWLINLAFWAADSRAGGRGNVMYLFPKAAQMGDFSRARVQKPVDESPYLRARTGRGSPEGEAATPGRRVGKATANVGLRQIGPGFLYLRGSQNRDSLLSVDADLLCLDEVAQYTAGTLDVAARRLGSSAFAWQRAGSTPRYPKDEMGVLWDQSTQRAYHSRCPGCGSWQCLQVMTHLDPTTATVRCAACNADMTAARLAPGEWIAASPGRQWEGYHVNKLLSPRVDLAVLAATQRRVLDGRTSASETQEFYNSDCGIPWLPAGGAMDAAQLDACMSDDTFSTLPTAAKDSVMGVDVGARLHIRINTAERDGRARAALVDSVRTFEELDALMVRFNVSTCVIDANPETRKAREFAERWPGRVTVAYYPNWGADQANELCTWSKDEPVVKINRTAALDAVQAMVAQRRLILPQGAYALGGDTDRAGHGEYYRHMSSPIRVIADNSRGNPTPHYEQNGPDHYAHAEVYAYVAAQQQGGLPFGWYRQDDAFMEKVERGGKPPEDTAETRREAQKRAILNAMGFA